MAAPGAGLRRVPTWLAVVVLGSVGGVVPVLVAHHFGALGIPRNDDWSYMLAAFRFAETGRLDLNGWAAVNVVGQIVPAAPTVWAFGRQPSLLQLVTVAFGLMGLVALFQLGCTQVTRPRALFVALMVCVSPLWAPLVVSYMTDVPAFALAMVTLTVGAVAFRRVGSVVEIRTGVYLIALAFGFWAYTVRDNMIVVPVALTAVAGWCAWAGSRRDRMAVLVGLGGWVLAFLAFQLWKHGATGYQSPRLTLDPRVVSKGVRRSMQTLPTVGLLLAPAVFLAGPVRAVRASFARAPRTAALVAVAVGGTAATVLVLRGRPLGVGNYLERNGALGNFVLRGGRAPLLPPPIFPLIGALAIAVVTVTAIASVRPVVDEVVRLGSSGFAPPRDPGAFVVALAWVGLGVFMVGSSALGNALWDRYVIVIVPLVALSLLRAVRPAPGVSARPRRTGAVVALVALGAFGLVYDANSASYDGSRWDVAATAVRAVGDSARVDGGFEWVDYHAGTEVYLFDRRRDRFCVVVRSEADRPRAGDPEVVAAEGVWGPTGTQTWIVARFRGSCRAG